MNANRYSKTTRVVKGRANVVEPLCGMFAGDGGLSGITKAA